MYKIIIISDLHIGTKDGADDFVIDEEKFIFYLENVKCDLLVLAGDVVECWESRSWQAEEKRFMEIHRSRKMLSVIMSLIAHGKAVWIAGNHDRVVFVKKLVPCVKRLFIEKEGVRVVIEHGHVPDIFNNRFEIIGKTLTWLCGGIERAGWKNAEYVLSKFLGNAPGSHRIESGIYKRYAERLQKKYDADIVCLGHTHSTKIFDYGKFVYVNSGKCCGDKFHFDEATLKIDGGNYEVSIR